MNSSLFTIFKNNHCTGITSVQLLTEYRHNIHLITHSSIISSCPTIQNIIAPQLNNYMLYKSLHHLKPPSFIYRKFSCISPMCCQRTIHEMMESLKSIK